MCSSHPTHLPVLILDYIDINNNNNQEKTNKKDMVKWKGNNPQTRLKRTFFAACRWE